MTNPIISERLDLISMTPAFLSASLASERIIAEQFIGVSIAPEWFAEQWLMKLRLDDVNRNPAYQPWSLRAVVLRERHLIIGHIGFHSLPDPDYLAPIAPGGVEFGYTIYPEFRKNGYALEASQAMIHWAHQTQCVTRFVLSISPNNVPSQRIAERLGFKIVGSQMDDKDGPENIYCLQLANPAPIND